MRKLLGLKTLGGHVCWEDTYTNGRWRIQHHLADFFGIGLKPYRLLDPDDCLMASSDNEMELRIYLDHLMKR